MRFWRYVEPGEDDLPEFHTLSETMIINEYWGFWCDSMRRVHKADQINRHNCITDWVVTHWAWEVPAMDTPINWEEVNP